METLQQIPESRKRLFEAYASVELKDSQGDIIPITEFEKVMPILMSRGAPIQLQHTNHHVGKLLNYQFVTKNTPAGDVPALKVMGEIFDDYASQDNVWKAIKNGELSGLSFGGDGIALGKYKVGDDTARLLADLEAYEFSVVDKPANPEATMDKVSIAKSEVKKPFADYEDFDACVRANQDASNPEAYCAAIHHQATGKWPTEKTKAFWQKGIEKEGSKSMKKEDEEETEEEKKPKEEETEEEKKPEEEEEKSKEKATQKQEVAPPAAPAANNEVAELRAIVESLATEVAQIKEVLAAGQPAMVEASKTGKKKQEGEPEKETLPKVPEEEPVDDPASEAERSEPESELVEKKVSSAVQKAVREELKKAGVTFVPAERAGSEPSKQPTQSDQLDPLAIARNQQAFDPHVLREHQINQRRDAIAKALGKSR